MKDNSIFVPYNVYLKCYPDSGPVWCLVLVDALSESEFRIGDDVLVWNPSGSSSIESCNLRKTPGRKIMTKVTGTHKDGFVVEEVSREEKINEIINMKKELDMY